MSDQVQALVVGAGISGLTAAYALQRAGISTIVLESSSRAGGVIQSVERDGFLLEYGPQSFSGSASITSLCRELHILDQRVTADPKAPRYVLINGKLQSVPLGPGILMSPLMTGSRGAIVRDLIGKSRAPESDESVANFVRRKFSSPLLDRFVGPFVSGVYAGDPEKLSLRASFPLLYEAEIASGSVVRGMFTVRKQRKSNSKDAPRERSTLQSFHAGNETLTRALATDLGEHVVCNASVVSTASVEHSPEPHSPRFRVTARTSRGEEKVEAERLVVAVPTDVAGKLLAPLNTAFEAPLVSIEYAGICIVSLGYQIVDVGTRLAGFGFLVPRSAGLNVLGTVWNSSLFSGRALDGYVLMTSFVGGATNPDVLKKSPDELAALVHKELTPILKIRNQPHFCDVHIVPRAIPQYNLGHCERLATVDKLRAQFPGLHLVGNYLKGPAVGTCVEQALKVADEIRVSFAN